jgi:glucose/arabinose dehydrogenase
MQTSRRAFISMIVLTAVTGSAGAQTDTNPPIETRPPNVPSQRPAFPGQTRACAIESNIAFVVVVLAKGLEKPWAVEPLPGGDLLITEKPGHMRIVSANGELGQPIVGVPAVDARGQGGLLDVVPSPNFAADRSISWSYTEPRQGGSGTSVARSVLSSDRRSLDQVRVIFRALPTYNRDLSFDPVGVSKPSILRVCSEVFSAVRSP